MNRKAVLTILRVLIAAVMLICACLPAFADSDDSPEALIEKAVRFYAYNGKRHKKAMAELAKKDPVLAEKWERILDIWGTPVKVNKQLPDGLPEDDTLCLIVLGYQLKPDGTMQTELVERLKVMLAAAQKYPNAILICTGGPTAYRNPDVTEAGRMAEWLIQNGIDPDRITTEDRSLTTTENAMFTFDILEERFPQVTQLAIISSDYHIATGILLYSAEAILRDSPVTVVSNAGWHAPSGSLTRSFQGSALIQISRELETGDN